MSIIKGETYEQNIFVDDESPKVFTSKFNCVKCGENHSQIMRVPVYPGEALDMTMLIVCQKCGDVTSDKSDYVTEIIDAITNLDDCIDEYIQVGKRNRKDSESTKASL